MTTDDKWGELPGEAEADAEREAEERATLAAEIEALARAEAAGANEPWVLPSTEAKEGGLRDLVAALEPDRGRAVRWLRLANRTGEGPVRRLLLGGRAGVEGLDDAERALDARLAEASDAADWLEDGGRTPPVVRPRVPLLIAPLPKDGQTENRTHGSYLPGGLVGLVVAAGGTGKTTWLAELAMRIAWGDDERAGGRPWPPLELAEPEDSDDPSWGPVLLFMAEEDHDGASRAVLRGLRNVVGETRTMELANGAGWPERVRMLSGANRNTALAMQVQLDDPVRGRVVRFVPSPVAEALFRVAEEHGPLLTVLDPINQLLPTGASENDATAAAAVMALAGQLQARAERGFRERWAKRTGQEPGNYDGPRPVVLLVHHESKAARADSAAGAGAARGSGAWTDNARWVLRMTREKTESAPTALVWTVEKSNYAREWVHRAALEEGTDGLAWRPWTEEDTEAVERVRAEKAKQRNGDKESLYTAGALVAALEQAGKDGMTKSAAEREHGREAVREVMRAKRAVEVSAGTGFRLYAREYAPADGETKKASEEDPMEVLD